MLIARCKTPVIHQSTDHHLCRALPPRVSSATMIPLDEEDFADVSENAFQKALSKWRDIDLSTLQTQLDKQGMEIIESQKDFLVERKELSTKTKLFRKLPDDEKLVQVMSLLKGSSPRESGLKSSVPGND
jgi:homeobox protein cut-like